MLRCRIDGVVELTFEIPAGSSAQGEGDQLERRNSSASEESQSKGWFGIRGGNLRLSTVVHQLDGWCLPTFNNSFCSGTG